MQKQISYKIVSLVFGILVFCFVVAFYVVGWAEPQQVPPGCTPGQPGCDAPINVGGGGQEKSGALTIKGGFESTGVTLLSTLGGNVGIGTPGPAYKLDVNGDINLLATGFLRIAGSAGSSGQVLTRTATGMAWQAAAGGAISTKRNTTDCVKVAWDGIATPHWCPQNYVVAGAEPNASDSYEWHWFWCCPLGE